MLHLFCVLSGVECFENVLLELKKFFRIERLRIKRTRTPRTDRIEQRTRTPNKAKFHTLLSKNNKLLFHCEIKKKCAFVRVLSVNFRLKSPWLLFFVFCFFGFGSKKISQRKRASFLKLWGILKDFPYFGELYCLFSLFFHLTVIKNLYNKYFKEKIFLVYLGIYNAIKHFTYLSLLS